MRRLRLSLVPALVFLVVAPLGPPTLAQSGEETSLRVQVERSSLPELPDNVAAFLTASGEPVAGATIEFWAEVEIVGARSAFLGSAVTDATGAARVPIWPRRAEYRIRAVFGGHEQHPPAEATVNLAFPADRVDPVEITAPISPFDTLRTVMPRAMGIVVALLWVFFAAAVLYVVRTMHVHAGPPPQVVKDE